MSVDTHVDSSYTEYPKRPRRGPGPHEMAAPRVREVNGHRRGCGEVSGEREVLHPHRFVKIEACASIG